jgi:glutaconate CoA-transferase subunit B
VVTQLGVYRPDAETGELVLVSIHPGATLEGVQEQAGWEIQVAEDVGETAPPTEEELRLIREELDPDGVYR